MSVAVQPTGPADLRDQRWLDERIEAARNGIEAVIDIAMNWTEGRCVSRLVPGVSAAEYVREHVGIVGREAIVPLLTESNWSNRQIAAVAGVSPQTVGRVAATVPDGTVDRPVLGADGRTTTPFRPRLADDIPYSAPVKPQEDAPIASTEPSPEWLALSSLMDDIEALTSSDAAYVAATVPERRRAATARRLRKLGTYLGRIAWTLEGNEANR